MRKVSLLLGLSMMIILTACSGGGGGGSEAQSTIPVVSEPANTPSPTPIIGGGDLSFSIGSANFSNGQFNISGSGLDSITSAKVQNGETESSLTISSQSGSALVVSVPTPLVLKTSLVAKLILSSASADTTINLTLEVASDSITSAMLKNGAVTDDKITSVSSAKISGTIDWSKLANIPTTFTPAAHGHNYSEFVNLAGNYMNYKPNNTACSDNQVLKWDNTNLRWVCGVVLGTSSSIDVGTGANNIIQLDTNSKLPAVDSSQLTNLPVNSSHRGLKITYNDPNKVDIVANRIALETDDGKFFLASNLSLNLDIALSGAGGLDTGVEANSTWYYIWVIYNGATISSIFSISKSAPTLPSGYTYKARIGVVRNNSSGNFEKSMQVGSNFYYYNEPVAQQTNNLGASYVQVDLSSTVPDSALQGLFHLYSAANGAGTYSGVCYLSLDGVSDFFFHYFRYQSSYDQLNASNQVLMPLPTAQRVWYKCSNASNSISLYVDGFILDY